MAKIAALVLWREHDIPPSTADKFKAGKVVRLPEKP